MNREDPIQPADLESRAHDRNAVRILLRRQVGKSKGLDRPDDQSASADDRNIQDGQQHRRTGPMGKAQSQGADADPEETHGQQHFAALLVIDPPGQRRYDTGEQNRRKQHHGRAEG